jgi:hypothetical protein
MSIELTPSRDPLRRLGSISLITGLTGLLVIVFVMVKFVQGGAGGEEWMCGCSGWAAASSSALSQRV